MCPIAWKISFAISHRVELTQFALLQNKKVEKQRHCRNKNIAGAVLDQFGEIISIHLGSRNYGLDLV